MRGKPKTTPGVTGADAAAELTAVSKSFDGPEGPVHALRDVNVAFGREQFTAVMGPSGSGKSTLMHIAAGLDTATSGRVTVGGIDITGLDDQGLTALRRRRIGFVFQSFNLVPTLDVAANIALPFELDGHPANPSQRLWTNQLVTSLGLEGRLRHRPHELSGGQQQRVAIARALSTRPDLVFADEPTGNLDQRSGREVLSLLRAASTEYGQSIAMVTHDPFAASVADRIVFLSDGKIVADLGPSTPEQISRTVLELEPAR